MELCISSKTKKQRVTQWPRQIDDIGRQNGWLSGLSKCSDPFKAPYVNYLHDRCCRKSDCFNRRRWATVCSDSWWGRWDYSSFNVVVGTVCTVGSSCNNTECKKSVLLMQTDGNFTFNIDRDSYLFWLPCICHSCQKSRPQFGFSPQYPHHHRHRHHWTTTPHPHPTILHLCGICKRNHNHDIM